MANGYITSEKKISDIYYSPSSAGAFQGPAKIHRVLRTTGEDNISIHKIRKFLQKQDDFNLQKPVKRKFKRARVIVSGMFEQFDADLMDMQGLAKENNNVRYLLVVIDVFSRFLWVQPLVNKTATEVLKAFRKIFQQSKPLKLRTDGGAEFKSQATKKYLQENNIYHHVTLNETKASHAERVILTLRRMIFRYLNKQHTDRYIDVLQQLVQSYNATPHRSLNNTAPKDVKESNEDNLWAYMYLKPYDKQDSSPLTKKSEKRRAKSFGFKIGQLVRISHLKGVFTKSHDEQWSYEVFKVSGRFLLQGIPLYKLQDLAKQPIKGNFYQSELQKVDKNENSMWHIEKIIRKRKLKGKMQGLVKWLGFPKKFNSWVYLDDIKDV